jgi:hypothetical protein
VERFDRPLSVRQIQRLDCDHGGDWVRRPRASPLTPERIKERVQMATVLSAKLRQTPGLLDRIVFTDECILRAEDTKLFTLRRPGRAVDPIRAPKYSAKVHVWGAIGKGVKELIFINGNIDSGKVLMQDGAPAHRSRYTTEFIRSQGLEILPWAAYSPDWNPIENLWSILQ